MTTPSPTNSDDEQWTLRELRAAIDEGDASEQIDEPEAMAMLRAALRARLRPDDRSPSTVS
ncbi:hypothetical protein [Rhodospirillum sp. A1_3_36]|uniref:hypothetical protein n=1 Tax=Rhodospirillum sp. A1_3_36 TaxID=3391666 RepID=UPI0039A4ADCA